MSDEVLRIVPEVEFHTNVDLSLFEVYVNGAHVGAALTLKEAWLIAGRVFAREFFASKADS